MISRSMVKSASGECHGCRVLENCIGGLSLCGKEELASWFVTCCSDMVSGGDREVQGLTLEGENPRSGLNWLCLTKRHYFVSADFFSRWKPTVYDRATTVLVHCSLLRGVAFWTCWTFGVILVVLVLMLQGIYQCSGAFSFSVIHFFWAVCIRIATRALRCCRSWM
jgi:hypothetical protein